MCASQVQVQEQNKIDVHEFFMKVYEINKEKIFSDIFKIAVNERYIDVYVKALAKMKLGMEKGIGFVYNDEKIAEMVVNQGWEPSDITVNCSATSSQIACSARTPNGNLVSFYVALKEDNKLTKQEYEKLAEYEKKLREKINEQKKILQLENEVKDLKFKLEMADRSIDRLRSENERLKSDREKLATIVHNLLFDGKVTREDIIKILQSLDKNAYEEELDRLLGNYVEDNDYEDP